MSMPYARFWQRAAAAAIDFMLVLVLGPVVAQLQTWRPAAFAVALLAPLVIPLYEIYFHGRWGQTIGKRLMNIAVVDVDGSRLRATQAVLRSSVALVVGLLSVVSLVVATGRITEAEWATLDSMQIATRQQQLAPYWTLLAIVSNVWFASEILTMLFNRRRRALHDFIAGTVVVDRAAERSELGPAGMAGKPVATALVVLCSAPTTAGVVAMAVGDAWLRADANRADAPAGPFFDALATYGFSGALLGVPLTIVAFIIGVGVLRSDRPRTRAGVIVVAALAASVLAVAWFGWDTLRLLV